MRLIDIIGSTSAISPRTGLKAYDFVADTISHSKSINISFDGITDCTSAFCNSFLGKLYMNFDPNLVDNLVHFSGIESNHIWFKKLYNARLLGTNENVRTTLKSNLNDLIHS